MSRLQACGWPLVFPCSLQVDARRHNYKNKQICEEFSTNVYGAQVAKPTEVVVSEAGREQLSEGEVVRNLTAFNIAVAKYSKVFIADRYS